MTNACGAETASGESIGDFAHPEPQQWPRGSCTQLSSMHFGKREREGVRERMGVSEMERGGKSFGV